MKKILVTIGRQCGTNGHDVGKKLAADYGINYYDNENMAEMMNAEYSEYFKKSGESVKADKDYYGSLFNIGDDSVRYATRNEQMFEAQTKVMKEIADRESAVIVGRCADYVLEGYEGLVTVYLGAPMEVRIKNIMARENLGEKAAKNYIKQMEKSRETYYRYYTDKAWGARENYDLCINTENLTEEGIAAIIKAYVDSI